MRRQKRSKWLNPLVIITTIMVMGVGTNESWAAEAKYPTRLIQMVVAYQPGETDMALRPFIDKLPEYLGQPVAFVYKPGANGTVGGSFVAKAKPDGYTLLCGTPSSLCPRSKTDYTHEDFLPICRLVVSHYFIAVKADSPWKTLIDIIEEAKKSPDKLTYTTSGAFSVPHILMEKFLKFAGIRMTHVPCTGSGPAVTALLGGHVSMTFAGMAPLIPQIKAGALRPIATLGEKRMKGFSDVPTVTELGYPVVGSTWYGLLAPKGTPEEVVKTIYTACKKINEDSNNLIEDRLEKLSLNLNFLGPEEYGKVIKEYYETSTKIIAEIEKSSPSQPR